jgi:hypothetical protein
VPDANAKPLIMDREKDTMDTRHPAKANAGTAAGRLAMCDRLNWNSCVMRYPDDAHTLRILAHMLHREYDFAVTDAAAVAGINMNPRARGNAVQLRIVGAGDDPSIRPLAYSGPTDFL